MFDYLKNIDNQILLGINKGHTPLLDELMWYASDKLVLIPLYLLTLYFIYKSCSKQQFLWLLVFLIGTIAFTDIISTQVFKEGIQRYRPSHNLKIGPLLHLYEESPGVFYKGGQFGFFSSHAANFFAFLAFVFPILYSRKKMWVLMLIGTGLLVCYSRIYLGVHYPSDIVAGIIFGLSSGTLFYKLLSFFCKDISLK